MPELPEVETVRRVVEPQIKGKQIKNVVVNNEKVISYPSVSEFIESVKGLVIENIIRQGKFLKINLDNGSYIVVHFRMSGSLIVTPKGYPMEKHTHAVIQFEDGDEIRYIDPRRFGRLWLIQDEEDVYTGIAKLGLEPFDENLTAEYLKEKLGRKQRAIKECLLDQSVVTGIGNIYGDEILFACKIRPTKKASRLTKKQWQLLSEKIPELLNFFIEKNAISNEDYLLGKGKDYRNTPYIRIYGHAGEPCPVCGNKMKKTVINGRSSVYCPTCQK